MKTIIASLLLLISTLSFANGPVEWDEVKTTQPALISLHELRCVTRLGSHVNTMFTELGGLHLNHRGLPQVHFEHEVATAVGCDRTLLDKLVDESFQRFGHASADIIHVLKTAKEPRIYRGQCMRNIQEQVFIDFGQGTVLETSRLGKLIAATGC
ncbi:MAG: hypothetical protein NXH75_03850 [Halobacteriovoraceae bacterium]|nr:hypothetical protein [Halobacteriovoraceae bacterium]